MLPLLLGLLLCGAGCGKSDPREAFRCGDYEGSLAGLRELAQEGDAEARNLLGVTYYLGLHLPRDYSRALELFEQAALQKHPGAQFNAGLLHFRGLGTPNNLSRAYIWFYAAARQGKDQAEPYVIFIGRNMAANQIMISMQEAEQHVEKQPQGTPVP